MRRAPLRLLARLGLLLGAVALVATCRERKKSTDTVSIDQPHPPDLVPGRELLASLERSGCFGECPVYRLTVFRDGTVVYVGTRWVKVLGRQELTIGQAELDALEGAFTRAGFLQMRDYDRVESTDDDWVHLSYRRGAFTRRVRHYRGDPTAPAVLSTLEDDFDRVVGSRRFVGGAAASGPVQLTAPLGSGLLAPRASATPAVSANPAPSASAPAASKPRNLGPELAPPETQE